MILIWHNTIPKQEQKLLQYLLCSLGSRWLGATSTRTMEARMQAI